jgi:cytochrome P450
VTNQPAKSLPVASSEVGLQILQGLVKERSLLVALELMHQHVGDIFQITLPGFQPAFLVGPAVNRQVLVSGRKQFLWRSENDPVTHLLRHGVLVEDGESHQCLRSQMEPFLQRSQVIGHLDAMQHHTDQVLNEWEDGSIVDMLVEMRKVALLILIGTLFSADFGPEMATLWQPILKTLKYISPGLWIIWPNLPRPGYRSALRQMDDYLFKLIRQRRENSQDERDLLGHLINLPEMSDDLIRDQLLTMLIAGHDTSTALLSWTLYLLGCHPEMLAKARAEVGAVTGGDRLKEDHLSQLPYLDQVIKESLRLYPPIHVGNRIAAADLNVQGYEIMAGTRVMYSIYLAHRDEKYWSEPVRFVPERFDRQTRHGRPAMAYVPFGGGPRNCIGASFAQIEAKAVLAQVLQRFELQLIAPEQVKAHMGATLEPRPGVMMQVKKRRNDGTLAAN